MGKADAYGGKLVRETPDGEETAGDLHSGRRQRAAHESKEYMDDLEHSGALHDRGRRAHHVIRGTRALVKRHEVRGEDRGHPYERGQAAARLFEGGEERR